MKKSIIILLNVLFSIAIFCGCVSEFSPNANRYESILVVEGFVSNEEDAIYTVKLSKSSGFDNVKSFITNAEVMIIDNDGNEYKLTEDNLRIGTFHTTKGQFKGEIGKEYKVYIKLDGKEYGSDFEIMNEVPDIDTIYYDFFRNNALRNDDNIVIEGLTIRVDVRAKENVSNFLMWQYDETWKFKVPWETDETIDKQICYAKNSSSKFMFANLNDYKGKHLKSGELYSISTETNRLTLTYSTLIKQYGISETAYQYYRKQKEQLENVGSLFDKTPISIIGNVKCITDPEEPVLGLFRVAGVKSKRIFIYNSDIQSEIKAVVDVEDCKVEYYTLGVQDKELALAYARGMINMKQVANGLEIDQIVASTPLCFDCTAGGHTTEVPDFWIEKE